MRPEPLSIIETYYDPSTPLYRLLITHSQLVAEKALEIALSIDSEYTPNLDLIHEACMLHDIGIFLTHSPQLYCYGDHPYVAHGILGRDLLESYGLFKHALICERHIGAGISARDIREGQLPLPERDMLPLTAEEKIVCLADNFYSKNPGTLKEEKSMDQVRRRLRKHGEWHVKRLNALIDSIGYQG